METIFDYNPTDEELVRFGGRENLEKEKAAGYDMFKFDDNRYYALALLFSSRGDNERFKHYCSLIKNKDMLGTLMMDF